MEFRILGPIEVVDRGVPLPLGGRKQRALLALLLLNVDEVVSADRLIDALWGEGPPRTAPTSLQNSVSHLRKLLGAERLVTKAPGYVLRLEDDQLDVVRVRQLVDEARTSDAEGRARLLREAQALWRGPPLADFSYDAFAQTTIAQLEELRLSVVEEGIDAQLELGLHSDLVGRLEALVAEHPLRERLRGQLMLALYRAGRQADALRVYQDARHALLEELGIDPGPALQRLHSAILRQERSLYPVAANASSEENLEEVARAVLAGRLVPVLGTEVGELAQRLAERFELPAEQGAELTRVAQYVALMKGSGPLYDELHELLGRKAEPTSIHRFFAALPRVLRAHGVPHQLVVTTSYDLALEQAFLDEGEEFDVVSYLAAGGSRGRFCHFAPDGTVRAIDVPNTYTTELGMDRRTVILKLHGGVDSAPERGWESFVITEDDYIDYLAHGDVATAIPVGLAAHLRRSHFLFLGYAMSEWNLRLVLNRLWAGGPVTYRSWAVAPSARPVERAFWRSRDVDLLEAPLEEYVESLARHTGVGVEATK
ncbi:MAG: BTAD domain-containing putative transcriptional regulator [Gaiellales bacterium]